MVALNGKEGCRVTTGERIAVGGIGLMLVILGHKLIADALTTKNKN
jgi:hypothetical protein